MKHGTCFCSGVVGLLWKRHKFIPFFMGSGFVITIASTRTEYHIYIHQPIRWNYFLFEILMPGVPWHAPECCRENGLPRDPKIKDQASLGPRTVSDPTSLWCPLNMLRPKEHLHGRRRTCVPFGASSPPRWRNSDRQREIWMPIKLAGAHLLIDMLLKYSLASP